MIWGLKITERRNLLIHFPIPLRIQSHWHQFPLFIFSETWLGEASLLRKYNVTKSIWVPLPTYWAKRFTKPFRHPSFTHFNTLKGRPLVPYSTMSKSRVGFYKGFDRLTYGGYSRAWNKECIHRKDCPVIHCPIQTYLLTLLLTTVYYFLPYYCLKRVNVSPMPTDAYLCINRTAMIGQIATYIETLWY